ncbi:NAD(P)/FAD-dependent oxidoreductase [Methylophilaceae bacterium]|nr:NAD(P)/FAD-dependent oxidoreductase [Methylophilaceae bacterium]
MIIGGGYTGIIAAHELSKQGKKVTLIEKEEDLGGLARSFDIGSGVYLERFYHHWFTSDKYILDTIKELGCSENIIWNETNTGMYFSNNFYKLSSPLDLLKFRALSFIDRIRLGLLTIKARYIKDWKKLENYTAEEWLIKSAGRRVYQVVWEPLLKGKFGTYKDKVSAVWIWNKLKLRGGSRNKKGGESLAYYKGGFAALTEKLEKTITTNGVELVKMNSVKKIMHDNNSVEGVELDSGEVIHGDKVISTVSLPILNKIFSKSNFISNKKVEAYREQISTIEYIGNVCLILVLNRSLTNTYWTNVNDPDFPFVALIEHTNFEPPQTYKGKNIVYLSKYLPVADELYSLNKDELLEFSLPYIKRMFKDFKKEWLTEVFLWKEPYSQPIITKRYSEKIPEYKSPIDGLYVSCMAQIYPEDRGTNYAVMQGKKVAKIVLN